MFDKDGYPTKEALQKIKNWDSQDKAGLVEYLQEIWHYPEDIILTPYVKNPTDDGCNLILHTMGWSGNESVIFFLEKNIFWFFHWMKSLRGGHYYFRVPIKE